MTSSLRSAFTIALVLLIAVEHGHAFPMAKAEVVSVEYPTIVMTTDPIPPATVEETWLEDQNGTRAKAISLERLSTPITVAFVVSSDRRWLRGDDAENDPLNGYALADAMIRNLTSLTSTQGSAQLAIVTYDREARVVLPLTEARRIPPQPLGAKEGYASDGRALESGIALGLDQLARTSTPRKLLVLLSDGQGDDPSRLEALERRARDESVEVIAVAYTLDHKGEAGAPQRPLSELFDVHYVTSPIEATTAAQNALANARDTYRVRLDARDLTWDGELHSVTLRIGSFDFGRRLLHLPRHNAGLPRSIPLSALRWPLLAVAIAVLVALVAIVRTRGTRPPIR